MPEGIVLADGGKLAHKDKDGKLEVFHAGRLTLDSAAKDLQIFGVLPDNERDNMIEQTAPAAFQDKVKELKALSEKIDGKEVKSVEVKLDSIPTGFDMKYAGLKKSVVLYQSEKQTLTAFQPLVEKETKGLLVAGGEPQFPSDGERLVFALVRPGATVQRLCDQSYLGEFETCRVLHTLIKEGYLEPILEENEVADADAQEVSVDEDEDPAPPAGK